MIREVKRVIYGRTTLPESWVFAGGDRETKLPIILSVFLIVTERKRILVDAGCETMPGFELRDFRTPMEALRDLGVAPESITDLVLTHAHHDHIECAKYFSNAVVYIQEKEAAAGGKYLQECKKVQTFDQRLVIDDGVVAVCIGGHAKGSSVVECSLQDEVIVLAGDECYTSYNLNHRVPTASTRNPENSRQFIEKYTQPPYRCWLCHDM